VIDVNEGDRSLWRSLCILAVSSRAKPDFLITAPTNYLGTSHAGYALYVTTCRRVGYRPL